MAATDSHTSEARRFQIRLPRPLWIGVAAVVLLVLAVGLHVVVPIYRQQAVIREIEIRGGYVESDDQIPVWVLRIWSRLYSMERERIVFREVHEVDLSGEQFTDADLVRIGALHHVRRLDLTLSRVTDAGMPHLAAFGQMETLNLSGTGVTDAGLAYLKTLNKLRKRYVVGTQITDDGIDDLKDAVPGTASNRLTHSYCPAARETQFSPVYNRAWLASQRTRKARVPQWIETAFVASFFLPVLYCLSLTLLSSKGTEAASIATFLISILTPVAVIVVSKQSLFAKIGQILLAGVAWSVIQFVTLIAFGVASLVRSGLDGIP